MKKLLLLLITVPIIGFSQCVSGDCENGYGTYIWDNGDKYVGEHKNGMGHGQGTYTYAKGKFEYVGEWKDGERHGLGTLIFGNGLSLYHGEWRNGKQSGWGTEITYDEDGKFLGTFVGEWENGDLHGWGAVTLAKDVIYRGYFEHGDATERTEIVPKMD